MPELDTTLNEKTLLAIKGLKTYFQTEEGKVRAVDGIGFEIKKGETVGLVGESGCGKTVTALSILKLVPSPPGQIVDGEILFESRDLLKMTANEIREIRGNKIAMIFQEPSTSFNPVMTIGDQIMEAIMLHQRKKQKQAETETIQMLRLVRIPDQKKAFRSYPHELSGGMKQRAMIAMALSCRPKLLIADEPTTSLDVTIAAQILELIKDLRRDFGTSVLLITHDLGVVAQLCDKVTVMYAGRIVEMAGVEVLYENPMHPYTQGLLNSVAHSQEEEGRLHIIRGSVPDLVDPPSGCRFHPRCAHAMKICSEKEPESKDISEEHSVACHLYQ